MTGQTKLRGLVIIFVIPAALPIFCGEIFLAVRFDGAKTPETRTLTAAEESAALERDWLFQAMGEPLLQRSAKEIGWARELAARLARKSPAPDLSAELRQLDVLEKRITDVSAKMAAEEAALPAWGPTLSGQLREGWIWFPEGDPRTNAPAEARFFRLKFDAPADVSRADLRVAADDACELYINGTRVGANDTWSRASHFDVRNHLRSGTNLIAVRAENKPANGANPAGLIVGLVMTGKAGKQTVVTSNAQWRTISTETAGWEQPATEDSSWLPAVITAPYGGTPWGKIPGLTGDGTADDSLYPGEPKATRDLYFAVRRVKRQIVMKNRRSTSNRRS